MKYFDMHVHSAFSEGESSIEQIAERAKILGYSGICFSEYYKGKDRMDELKAEIEKVSGKCDIDIFLGFEARTTKEIKTLSGMRGMFDVLLVHGGDLKVNRAAVETKEVDILTHPEHGRYDCGMNHVMAKLAKKNNVAIEINFREILIHDKKTRATLLSNMRDNIKLAKKYKAPIILCSGSISHWELRDHMCITSMASELGMDEITAKYSISKIPESILKLANERKSKKWIMPGVKVK